MARKKTRKKNKTAKKTVEQYEHRVRKRLNAPHVGLLTPKRTLASQGVVQLWRTTRMWPRANGCGLHGSFRYLKLPKRTLEISSSLVDERVA